MHILLTNDDGYNASGIQTLYRFLRSLTKHEISIIAPENQRSASGRSITLHKPLFLREYYLDGGQKGYATNGTPSDCVKLAIQGEVVAKLDLIISGINFGPNLGTDIFYSGTVAAAMEGVLLGVPALAVSSASYEYKNFESAANYLVKHLEVIVQHNQGHLMNINFPGKPEAEWRGVKVTRLSKAVYEKVFEQRVDPRGRTYYWQGGTAIPDLAPDTDFKAIHDDYVSMTPIHSDLTDFKRIETLKNIFEKK
ncbi:MAG: 5'/3'-nucleotidase SurE [Syntrophomonadaceae bacterium]|nr:5'/3'-nucleotidase SurE [Syntrophomonadaceae bacterium]